MNFKLTAFSFCFFFTANLFSQDSPTGSSKPAIKYTCGTEQPSPEWDQWFNSKVVELKSNLVAGKTQLTSLTIPVIVHVVHGGQAVNQYPNLSELQIKSQIAVLNNDFAGTGFNVGLLANTGFSVVGAANCQINFCLAENDPNGTPLAEPGIERINYISKGWTSPTTPTTNAALKSLVDGVIKPNTIWDPTYYFNIWLTDINTTASSNVNLLGYATFPGGANLTGLPAPYGSSNTDGIWVRARSFGNTGILLADYDRGRTATHEVGHWLGLRHIGGDALNSNGDCNATDYCNDTPPQMGGNDGGSNGQNFGSPSYPLHSWACNALEGDMYMNFMDYTLDAAKYMFTPDQALRIQTAMTNGHFRNQLSASSATLCTGAPSADFTLDSIACIGSDTKVLELSTGAALSYSWSTNPSTGVTFSPSSNSQNPQIYYSYADTYTVSLKVTNSLGVSSTSYVQRLEDCTGLRNVNDKLQGILIFPNPSSGKLTLRSAFSGTKEMQVQICNSLGEVLFFSDYIYSGNPDISIDLSFLESGLYAITLSTAKERTSRRFVITK